MSKKHFVALAAELRRMAAEMEVCGDSPERIDGVRHAATALGSEGYNPNTIRNKIAGLSALAAWMLERRDGRGLPLIPGNPTVGFKKPKVLKRETKFLYPAELVTFVNVPATEGVGLARELMLYTGVRCLEACEANVGDLTCEGYRPAAKWTLTIQVKGRRQAGAEPARIPVPPRVAEQLTNAVLARGAAARDPLIVDGKNLRFRRTQLGQAMIYLGQRAGLTRLSTSPHKLRHTANVVARLSGVERKVRAAMLNHRSMATLDRYDHLVPGEVEQGRELQTRGFDSYFRLAPPEVPSNPAETQANDTSNS
jgi:integrase